MLNRNTFARHLDEYKTYLGYLSKLKKYSKKDVLDKWYVYGLVERYLQLSIECALSLGEQIISSYGYRIPSDYKDILNVLVENKVIPKSFGKKLEGMAGFRNILVHGYTK
ncbi:MAG: HepT-like ribonuclease domain-containing protein, partial [Candidatus Margulisiibacteriota bacterium]